VRPPEDLRAARVTVGIAVATAAAWLLSLSLPQQGLWSFGGFIPARFNGGSGLDGLPAALTPLSATLLHADFVHLFFNIIFLLICGRAVEPVLGGKGLAVLYLVGAYAAAAAQYAGAPLELTPMIGASGAVSAVIGAYALLFGRNKVRIANPALAVAVNALWLAAAWVGLQMLIGYSFGTAGLRIAVAAHIGGFLAGLLLARPLLSLRWRGA
jgi:membrane associated rhomboid family serine protease